MSIATHSSPADAGRYPHRNLAIRRGRLKGRRCAIARARYGAIIEAFCAVGAAHLLTRPLRERAIEAVLNDLAAGPEQFEALEVMEHFPAWILWLRRNDAAVRQWVREGQP